MRRLAVFCAAIAATMLLANVRGQAPPQAFAAGELLIKFDRGVGRGQRDAILANRGLTRIRQFANVDIDHVRLPPGVTVANALNIFNLVPGIAFAQPNYVRHVIQSALLPSTGDRPERVETTAEQYRAHRGTECTEKEM